MAELSDLCCLTSTVGVGNEIAMLFGEMFKPETRAKTLDSKRVDHEYDKGGINSRISSTPNKPEWAAMAS